MCYSERKKNCFTPVQRASVAPQGWFLWVHPYSCYTPFLLLLRERLDILQPVVEMGELGGIWFRTIESTEYVKIKLRRLRAAVYSIYMYVHVLISTIKQWNASQEVSQDYQQLVLCKGEIRHSSSTCLLCFSLEILERGKSTSEGIPVLPHTQSKSHS